MQKQLISFSHVVKFLQHIKFKWGFNPNPPLVYALGRQYKDNRFGQRKLSEHDLKHVEWTKGLQNVVRWFLDADDNPDSHENLIISFLAHLQCSLKFACKFIPWYLH